MGEQSRDKGDIYMIEAFVLLTVEVDKVEEVIKNIKKKLPAVKEAKGVTGPYDVILRVDANDLKELTREIVSKIYRLSGVIDTTTAIVIETSED
jgi:DNA-binding Lrp family transcriptional regulator